MTQSEIKIKQLIKEQVDMGTFGLVELELRELVKNHKIEIEKLHFMINNNLRFEDITNDIKMPSEL